MRLPLARFLRQGYQKTSKQSQTVADLLKIWQVDHQGAFKPYESS